MVARLVQRANAYGLHPHVTLDVTCHKVAMVRAVFTRNAVDYGKRYGGGYKRATSKQGVDKHVFSEHDKRGVKHCAQWRRRKGRRLGCQASALG